MDAVALAFMSVGLILFTLADSRVAPNFDVTGMRTKYGPTCFTDYYQPMMAVCCRLYKSMPIYNL